MASLAHTDSARVSCSRNSRLEKELEKLNAGWNPYNITSLGEDSDGVHLRAILRGPQDSVYFGGEFVVDITVTPDYPFKPPLLKFMTNILHPCIVPTISVAEHRRFTSSEGGDIDLLELKDRWSPSITLNDLLDRVLWLLRYPARATVRTGHGGCCQTASDLLGDAAANPPTSGLHPVPTRRVLPEQFRNAARSWVTAYALEGGGAKE